ncbi:MAG: hypothetical protein HOC70_08470 [Gammaproteobacteria bacterium]|jgi:hypothetical protein|nr:hypothetical protein [Gammaproteobacteria bacterium]MBT4493267.1 hypothetical protein [Gammaproteobacteria bacterium]MBT7372164.1 hypothetical protein [Gammaproteobacteria bacterium]
MLNRLETLKAMGIEVWAVRNSTPVNQHMPEAVQQPIDPAPQRVEQSEEKISPPADQPEFRLALLHYESVGLCLSLTPGATLPRRLCDDVARMMGGNIELARFQMLEWPMLNTSGIDQSLASARQVVTQKFAVLPEKVVVFGGDVSIYFSPLKQVESGQPSRVGNQSFLVVPSLVDLMKSPSEKRNLMVVLSNWAP